MVDDIGYDFISIGEMVIDFIQGQDNKCFLSMPGGAPANTAVMVARNGFKTGFYGKFSADIFGNSLVSILSDEDVESLCKQPAVHSDTTITFVFLNEYGERNFVFPQYLGADWELMKDDINDEIIRNSGIVHFGLRSILRNPIREAVDKVLLLAHMSRKLVSCDINYRPVSGVEADKAAHLIRERLKYVDMLKISQDEVFLLGGTENIPCLMSEYEIPLVVETLGSAGARCYYKGNTYKVKGIRMQAVDTTGAGDSFWGSFISYLIANSIDKSSINEIKAGVIEKALKFANMAAGYTIRGKGAISSMPGRDQLIQFLEEI